jgi:uncharacterized protein (TIGR02117 family)
VSKKRAIPGLKLKQGLKFGVSLLLGMVMLMGLGLLLPQTGAGNATAACASRVCVVRYDYHAKLIVPIQNPDFNWREQLAGLGVDLGSPETQYVGFGWGAHDWYMSPPTTLSQTLVQGAKSLLWPNASVIKVQRYKEFPQGEHHCMAITPAHTVALKQFVAQTFQLDAQGKAKFVASDPRHDGLYYQSKGTYSLFDNCNHWTARALHLAGIDTPRWAAHAAAIMRLLRSNC